MIQEQRNRLITEQKAQLLAAHNAVASNSRSPIAVRSAVSAIGAMQASLEINAALILRDKMNCA